MAQNFHKSMVTCIVTRMATRGNAFLVKHKRNQKAKLTTLNEFKCPFFHYDNSI